MSTEQFKKDIAELYQGEVLGEVLFDQMLSHFQSPDERHKLSMLLQLETETKARLRPVLANLGVDLQEDPEFRKIGLAIASSMEEKSWEEAMAAMRELIEPALERYREIADAAPAEYRELAESMLVHELSLYRFVELELAAQGKKSIAAISDQIHNKIMPAE